MGRIKLKYAYTDLVEHYLRCVVREWVEYIPAKWYEFTTNWINDLSPEDREFIEFIFDKQYYFSVEGLICFKPSDPEELVFQNKMKPKNRLEVNRIRLGRLEQKFAFDSGLISRTRERPYNE